MFVGAAFCRPRPERAAASTRTFTASAACGSRPGAAGRRAGLTWRCASHRSGRLSHVCPRPNKMMEAAVPVCPRCVSLGRGLRRAQVILVADTWLEDPNAPRACAASARGGWPMCLHPEIPTGGGAVHRPEACSLAAAGLEQAPASRAATEQGSHARFTGVLRGQLLFTALPVPQPVPAVILARRHPGHDEHAHSKNSHESAENAGAS